MGTKYRLCSEADIYHVTTRGVAQQIIFEDDNDREFFLSRMRFYVDECEVHLLAWCLMSNHIHLLVQAELEKTRTFMHKLLASYAIHFNNRHRRSGHLFQGRFDSVPIETDEQLMTAMRYIHRNPLSIPGQSLETYCLSSYREYLGQPFITEVSYIMRLFDGMDEFVAFHDAWDPSDESELRAKRARQKVSDENAIEFAKQLLRIDSIGIIASSDKPTRNRYLATLKRHGLPVQQVSRITGLGRNIVQRAH
jgi:REP element-mobilizing transposase RayT